MDFDAFGIKTSYKPTGTPRKKFTHSKKAKPTVRDSESVPHLKDTMKKGKYTLKLVKDSGTGKPLLRTLYQFARFATHVEAQGYITKRIQLKKGYDAYATYISTTIVPESERKVEAE